MPDAKHVWTTFSDDQIDLNFENPQVLCQFVEILFDYINHGARFIRLDAIAFLWKRLGTSCMSLPETHMVVKIMRLLIDHSGAPVQLLTETNVPHAENVSYFGQQDEAHMVYQFSLAPLLLYSYLFNDGRYLQSWATALEQPPEGCAYLNFIASHDGIGLRPLEGLVPADDINKLINTIHERGGYVSMRTAADGNPKGLRAEYFAVFCLRWHSNSRTSLRCRSSAAAGFSRCSRFIPACPAGQLKRPDRGGKHRAYPHY